MILLCVMYPNEAGAAFDFEYFRTRHMALVREHMGPHGLIKVGIEKGLEGFQEGESPPYVCMASLYFGTLEECRAAMAAAGKVRANIAEFTNVSPIRQISEILE